MSNVIMEVKAIPASDYGYNTKRKDYHPIIVAVDKDSNNVYSVFHAEATKASIAETVESISDYITITHDVESIESDVNALWVEYNEKVTNAIANY